MGFSAVEAFPKCNILSVKDTSRNAPSPVFSPSPFPNQPDFRKLTSPRKPIAPYAINALEQFTQNPHLNKVTLGNKIYARVRSTCCGELLSSGGWKLLVDDKEGGEKKQTRTFFAKTY